MRAVSLWLLIASAVSAQASRPAYLQLRYDEDWSAISDVANRHDYLDPLKYVRSPLGYLTLGGEARWRYEYFSEFAFGAGPQDSEGYSLQRYLLHADWHVDEHWRVFTQVQSAIELGRNGGPRPTDDDRFEVHQAFVDYSWTSSGRTTIRLGRHEMDFGAGRLISTAEGLNVRRSFDGLRLIHRQGRWIVNVQANKLVAVKIGILNDFPDPHQTFWGGGATRTRGPLASEAVYYIAIDRKTAVFDKGVGRERRHSIGFHSQAAMRAVDYNMDAIYQFGVFEQGSASRHPIRAWAVSADTGYSLTDRGWRPRISMRTDVTSGDQGRSARTLGTFNPLFPATAYSDTIGLLGASNSIALSPFVRLNLSRSVTINAGTAFFWRSSIHDAIYGINVAPLRTGQLSNSRWVGWLPSFRLAYRLSVHWQVTPTLGRFNAGEFLRNTPPGKSTNYANLALAYRF